MKKFRCQLSILSLLLGLICSASGQKNLPLIPFELDSNTSATYAEAIAFYQALAKRYPKQFQFQEAGTTDSGFPLHVGVLSADGDFSPASLRAKGRRIFFINNGIHAGEPCGVDASMLLLRDYLSRPEFRPLLSRVVLVIIPLYNISGALNRGSYSRANQLGPAAYGFRGNAKNLDLNRDFIKCDSRNARSFNQLFTRWQPDVFIDTHTSNGADYQYTMTLIAGQPDKLESPLAEYMRSDLLPRLYKGMAGRGWEMTPYVSSRETPDEGIYGFLDLPRYSSGYAALHHTLPFIAEAHMLKPFRDRVLSCYALLDLLAHTLYEDHERIGSIRQAARELAMKKDSFPLHWGLDQSRRDSLFFKGYTAAYRPSEISGLQRLYYDRSLPYEKWIPYFPHFKETVRASRPVAYLIPQAYQEVVERLRWNGVQVQRLSRDLDLELENYYIRDFKTTNNAYEGHYQHSEVVVEPVKQVRKFYQGDFVVFTRQPAARYLMETLEPQGADSFFAWNFFDGILMQKEYFSSYVFEDLAAEYLRQHPELRDRLEQKKREDPKFAASARAQLDFVYRNSPYYEPTHNRYPVARLMAPVELPLVGQK